MEWLDSSVILAQIMACVACYWAGKTVGINSTVELFLDNELITEEDLDNL